jgi:hypothetical protein
MQYYILYEKEMIVDESVKPEDFTDDKTKNIEVNTIYNDINIEDLKKGTNTLSNNLYKEFYMNPAILKADETKYLKDKLYQYILVKIKNDKPKVIHAVGPRSKINFNDMIYFSLHSFQLGPLLIKQYNL